MRLENSFGRWGALAAVSWIALGVAQSHAQTPTPTQLETLTIVGESGESPVGPDDGIVAKRSRAGSKTDTPLVETPQAVSVVTRDQMEAQGAETVAQALRYTPGVLPDPNGFDIRYDWLYVRGFNAFGVTWLDGLGLPSDPGSYAIPSINPYALERVEVIKGPASVLYGSSVPGGLVNQVSKRPQAEPEREVFVGTNGFGGIQGGVDMTGKLTEDGEWLYRFVGSAENLHTQVDQERDRQFMLAPSVTWAPTDDTSLTMYGYFQRDRPIFNPRFYPALGTLLPNPAGQVPRDVFLGDPNWGEFERDFYAAGYEFEHDFNETWTVRQNLRYSGADQNMNLVLVNPAFAYPPGPPGTTLNRVTATSDDDLRSLAVDTQAEAEFATGAFDHTVLFGLDYIRTTSEKNFGNTGPGTFVPPIDYLDPEYGFDFPQAPITRSSLQTQEQIGIYAQDQIRYDNWIGTFGLRYDNSEIETEDYIAGTTVDTADSEVSVRAGLTYLFDNGLAPYASYMTAFLPQLGTDESGAPFDALTAEQFEVGLKYEPYGSRGMIAVSLFNLDIENALTTDGFNTAQTGASRVRGVEVEGRYELTPSIDILASYAYSDSEIVESEEAVELGREMLRLPEHQGSVWVNYRPAFLEGLSLSAGVRALSSYQSDAGYLPQLRIPSRTLVDFGAQYDFGALNDKFEGTTLQVNLHNAFDEEYVSLCTNATGGSCNFGAGRTITASLKYKW